MRNTKLLFGPPASGKGSLVETIHGIVHIQSGPILKRRQVEPERVRCGKLVSDEEVIPIVLREIKKHGVSSDFIIDGCPRSLGQVKVLLEFLWSEHHHVETVLVKVDKDTIIERALKRRREDDKYISSRLNDYELYGPKVLEALSRRTIVHEVDNNGDLQIAQSQLRAILGRSSGKQKPLPLPFRFFVPRPMVRVMSN